MADPVVPPVAPPVAPPVVPPVVPPAVPAVTPPAATPPPVVPPKAPETYELKLPEGSLLDPAVVAQTAAYAKENGLTSEAAQKVLEQQNTVVKTYADAEAAKIKAEQDSWAPAAVADKEIGGADYAKNAELARRVIARYGTEDFKNTLNATGLGNHPELLRVFVRIGKLMSEDQLIIPGAQPVLKASPEDILYPTHKK